MIRFDFIEQRYSILEKYQEFKSISLEYISTSRASDRESDESQIIPEEDDAYAGNNEFEEKRQFMYFLSGVVGTRVVLLQLIPIVTAVSVFAVDFASSPIFVFSKELASKLPPLIVNPTDAWKQAEDDFRRQKVNEGKLYKRVPGRLVKPDVKIPEWKLYGMTLYIMTMYSRLVQFLLKLYINLVAIAIIFFPQFMNLIVLVTVIVLLLIGLVQAIYALILLEKLIFSSSEDEEDIRPHVVVEFDNSGFGDRDSDDESEYFDMGKVTELDSPLGDDNINIDQDCNSPIIGPSKTSNIAQRRTSSGFGLSNVQNMSGIPPVNGNNDESVSGKTCDDFSHGPGLDLVQIHNDDDASSLHTDEDDFQIW